MSNVNANQTSFSSLFNSKDKFYLVNEDYQRDYSWVNTHVSDFLENYTEELGSDSKHYLGTLFVYKGDPHLELVDGQHRVITGILLLLSLYPFVSEDIKFRIRMMTTHEGRSRVRPYRKNQQDEIDGICAHVIEGKPLDFDTPATPLADAYLQIQNTLLEYIDAEQLDDLANVVLDSDVVRVTFDSEEDAIRAFKIQNSGGKVLTILDKMRTLLIEKDASNKDNIGEAIEILEQAGLASNGKDDFRKYVSHYLDSEPMRIPQIKKFVEYTLSKHGDTKFTEAMVDRAKVYLGMIRGENTYDDGKVDVFRKLHHSTTYTNGDGIRGRKTIDQSNYLLLEANDKEDFYKLSRMVFFLRFYLNELSERRVYNSVFMRNFYQRAAARFKPLTGKKRRDFKPLTHNGSLTSETSLGFISREEWLVRDNKYKSTRDRTIALYLLENYLSRSAHQEFLSTWSSSTGGYHVEHILPRKTHPELINSIGNLVILKGTTNSKLQDSSYETRKREEYLKHRLELCTRVAEDYEVFDETSVIEREIELDNLMYDILYAELVA